MIRLPHHLGFQKTADPRNPEDHPDILTGQNITVPFDLTIPEDCDVWFHRILLPDNADAALGSGIAGFKYGNFPAFENIGTSAIVQDPEYGTALEIEKLHALIVRVRLLDAAEPFGIGVNVTLGSGILPGSGTANYEFDGPSILHFATDEAGGWTPGATGYIAASFLGASPPNAIVEIFLAGKKPAVI